MPLTAARSTLTILQSIESTNTELIARSSGAVEFSALLTTDQTAGKGRLGRVWVAPSGSGVALSVLLRPKDPSGAPLGLSQWGWLPLMAGLAMTRAISTVLSSPEIEVQATSAPQAPGAGSARELPRNIAVKWPNDVLIDGKKVSGILTELLPAGDGLVVGVGVNLFQAESELPTATSTSLALAGCDRRGSSVIDELCSLYLQELRELYRGFCSASGDPDLSGLRAAIRHRCSTLGRPVRVHLPSGDALTGIAVDLDHAGRVRVRSSGSAVIVAVAAGDVEHLRYE